MVACAATQPTISMAALSWARSRAAETSGYRAAASDQVLGPLTDDLDEAQRVVVGSYVALGRQRVKVDAGDPLLVHLPGHAAHASHAVGGGDQPHRDAAAFREVVVVRPRPVALDVGPRSSRRSAVELHPSVHPDHRLHDVRRQPTDP